MEDRKPKLIVHGGAWSIPDEMDDDHLKGVRRAIARTWPKLMAGMSALDAVECAVKILEEDPTFDAGRGAFLNAAGEIELDAMMMDGETLNFGAVAGIRNILHPVTVARKVMEETEHCFLIGPGAQEFARQAGIPEVDPRELLTSREMEFYNSIKNDPSFTSRRPFEKQPRGTVGAVAMDMKGNIAAATSTGGTPRKMPGRIGDSPIIGCGTYADNCIGAASATGWGESIMKVLLSKTACDMLREDTAMRSAERAIGILRDRVNGWGGIILMDARGNYGYHHNTSKMAFALINPDEEIISRMTCH